MFLGTYQTRFSGKNRVILPKKFRVQLDKTNQIVLTRGLDGCIWGFAKKDWEKEAKKQLEIPITEQRGRFLRRYIFSEAESLTLDSQGRFIIPPSLLKFAQVQEEVLLVGAGDHFEVWAPNKWQDILKQESGSSE